MESPCIHKENVVPSGLLTPKHAVDSHAIKEGASQKSGVPSPLLKPGRHESGRRESLVSIDLNTSGFMGPPAGASPPSPVKRGSLLSSAPLSSRRGADAATPAIAMVSPAQHISFSSPNMRSARRLSLPTWQLPALGAEIVFGCGVALYSGLIDSYDALSPSKSGGDEDMAVWQLAFT